MATRPFIVLGDHTDHGGIVIGASRLSDTHGKGIARVGDQVTCPKKGHGTTVIVTGDPTMIIDGQPAARHGDKCACGATLISKMGGIAWAVANRARAWGGKTIDEMISADPNYTYVVKDGSPRYNRFMKAKETDIPADSGMALALKCAQSALANTGADPSNGAYWWDGLDFKTNYSGHPKVRDGFHFAAPEHNIYDVKETGHETTIYWKVRDKKTGKEVNSKVRGQFKYVWESTAAYGGTIFWKHDADYLTASGGRAYR